MVGDHFTKCGHAALSSHCCCIQVPYRKRKFCSLNINQLFNLTQLWRSSYNDHSDTEDLCLKTMCPCLDHKGYWINSLMLSQKKSRTSGPWKQEKGTLIQYSTVNPQICLITGSWSNLVNEKPSITILFFAKPAPGIFGWFYCLGRGISERHRSSLDPRATWPLFLQGSTSEPQRLGHSSSCLCTNPPPAESTPGLLWHLATALSPTPRSAHGRHWPDCAHQRAPAPTAKGSCHPGVVPAVHQL